MEALSRLMDRAGELNLFRGISMGKEESIEKVSHLFFTDDILIFCEPDLTSLLYLRCILLSFQLVSGLKINMKKIKMVRIGGLGIRSIMTMNYALHGKWLWRFGDEYGKLWRRVVAARWENWEMDGGRRGKYKPHGMSLWKKISKGGSGFVNCVGWQIGNGRGVRFWQDEWFGVGRLMDKFPNLFHC